MISLSNLTTQTLQPGQALTLSKIFKSRNGCECFNTQAPTSVKLCERGTYELSFSGNITGDTAGAPVQIAIAVAGSPLVDTAMNSVPAAAGDLNNVATNKLLKNCCCDLDRVSIVNSGTNPVTVAQNASFNIHRLS